MRLQSYFLFKTARVCSRGGKKCLNAEAETHIFIYSCNHQIEEVEESIARTHSERFVLPLCSPGTVVALHVTFPLEEKANRRQFVTKNDRRLPE